MSRRFAQAALMAARAHAGQLRRGGDTPYINHPLAVAAKVAEVTGDEDVLCAAVLHDTVEDTDVTLAQIGAALGARVAGIVEELTDPPAWDDLPTIERKARQAEEYRGASAEARTIKIADQWANVSDLADGGAGRDAAWLRGYLDTSAGVVAVCRPAAPVLADAFDAAAGRLNAFIAGLEA